MEKKKIIKAEVEKVMDRPEAKIFRKTLNEFLDQEVEIETPDILNEAEKRYLRAVLRPFRNKVIYIRKYFYSHCDAYSIEIYIKSVEEIFNKEYLKLPLFKNEMYKGMEKGKNYTLEELDL